MKYSLLKGFLKGAQSVLVAVIAVASVTAVGQMDLGQVVQDSIVPELSGVTIVGALTMVLNYIKVKRKSL